MRQAASAIWPEGCLHELIHLTRGEEVETVKAIVLVIGNSASMVVAQSLRIYSCFTQIGSTDKSVLIAGNLKNFYEGLPGHCLHRLPHFAALCADLCCTVDTDYRILR